MKKTLYLLALSLVWSCSTTKETAKSNSDLEGKTQSETAFQVQAQAPQIIYKTKADFSELVPILMDKEKTKIIGFPAPRDLNSNGELQTPIALEKGFYYDRRGISKHSVFLNKSYTEYAALSKTPSINDLKSWILEKDPFVAIYFCPDLEPGSDVEALNAIVKSGFKNCKKIK